MEWASGVELASCQFQYYVGAGRFQYMLGRAGCPLYCYAQPVEWASGVELASCQFQYMLGRAVGGQCFGMGWGADLIGLMHCPPYIKWCGCDCSYDFS
ncbi:MULTISPECIES: hypothetical protein [unclassified Moorena]|uniref:hypothetical protein n=1 Tax=unclassified Moorena TaxID=2683338 RepID=UPI0013FFE834|nr:MULTISPECIES: hypothetical protein [unclassified Moorena]NEO13967.1 hypothetical protein [Moorena sp. SIO3E8]NEQ00029.1 hypothetical protein [Moorena sp. SIO3F7]